MRLADFDYKLPDDLIAQQPTDRREASRMMVVNRHADSIRDRQFTDFPDLLTERDVLVINNTRVFPARLLGHSDTGAAIEIFLVAEISDSVWEALSRPARRLPAGKRVTFGDLHGTIVENRGGGHVIVEFEYEGEFHDVLSRVGKTPLPPYIKRQSDDLDADRERYQTIYARSSGAIAAPTAGLHFTDEVFQQVRSRGVEIVEITLHVGYGTFEPVRAEDLSEHSVSPERYEIGQVAAESLNAARSDGRRIIAIGTTTTRALETAIREDGTFLAGSGTAGLTITPGYEFRVVQAMLTNFHLPQSSLLILVSTFGGHKLIMKAYEHAVAERYRFYSYGDCMFIE